jgi:integrase
MATFRKRNGKWQARVQINSGPTQARTFFKQSDAKLWARKIEESYQQGLFEIRPEPLTLYAAFERYLKDINPRKKRAYIERYRIYAWMAHAVSQRRLEQIRTYHLAAWRDERSNMGFQPNTIRLHLAVLSHLYTVAQHEWGYEGLKNPVRHLHKLKLPGARDIRINDDAITALIQHTQSPYLPSLIQLALLTAMRRSELIKLQWEDIDWSKQLIHLKDTKNGESRQIPIFDKVKVILESIEGDKGPLFPIKEHAVTVAFRRTVKRSELVNISFHTLRHEAITRFFEVGLTIPEVASISGHKSWAMLRRYTHLRSQSLINKLNN